MAKPVLQALVLADHIYQDKDTSKMIIAGTFTRSLVKRVQHPPASNEKKEQEDESGSQQTSGDLLPFSRAGSPYAYLCLTDIRNTATLELRYVDLTDNGVLFNAEIKVACNDPLQAVEMKIPLPELPTPHLGEYSLELLCADELLGSWRVSVESVDESTKEE